MSEIHSDGSKRIYLRELTERGRLDGGQLRDVMRSARTIGSDGDKTGLLVEVSPLYLKPGLRERTFRMQRQDAKIRSKLRERPQRPKSGK